jgi:hypothetical protein
MERRRHQTTRFMPSGYPLIQLAGWNGAAARMLASGRVVSTLHWNIASPARTDLRAPRVEWSAGIATVGLRSVLRNPKLPKQFALRNEG